MRLYLTGEPCNQQRHCYFVEGGEVSFIVDCGYQRSYVGDELPHLTSQQIRSSRYLFLTHSHENQSGALDYLYTNGFTGSVVTTTETARQLTTPIDNPIILEGLCLPYAEAELPGGLKLVWGRSGHCSGSAWFSITEGGRTLFFSGDYYTSARVHMADPIVGLKADLAVLDCDYGTARGSTREEYVDALMRLIEEALADGRPVLLPVPKYGRGLGILTHISQRMPEAYLFADEHFLSELSHLDASAMWVQPSALDMLASCLVRPIPEEFVALGVYFVSDPQLDTPAARELAGTLLQYGARVIFTGTVEPKTHAALMLHAGTAQKVRYGVHCTQEDMLAIAAQNNFKKIIAYRSDYEPTQSVYTI